MRWFNSWIDFCELLVLVTVGVDGVCHASWLWIAIGAMLLFLLRWPRWSELIRKAGEVDANYRDRGRLAFLNGLFRQAFAMYSRARLVPLVLGATLLEDAFFLAVAYAVGMGAAWLWGVDFSGEHFSISNG